VDCFTSVRRTSLPHHCLLASQLPPNPASPTRITGRSKPHTARLHRRAVDDRRANARTPVRRTMDRAHQALLASTETGGASSCPVKVAKAAKVPAPFAEFAALAAAGGSLKPRYVVMTSAPEEPPETHCGGADQGLWPRPVRLRDRGQQGPSLPWWLWLCPGCCPALLPVVGEICRFCRRASGITRELSP